VFDLAVCLCLICVNSYCFVDLDVQCPHMFAMFCKNYQGSVVFGNLKQVWGEIYNLTYGAGIDSGLGRVKMLFLMKNKDLRYFIYQV